MIHFANLTSIATEDNRCHSSGNASLNLPPFTWFLGLASLPARSAG